MSGPVFLNFFMILFLFPCLVCFLFCFFETKSGYVALTGVKFAPMSSHFVFNCVCVWSGGCLCECITHEDQKRMLDPLQLES